MTQIGPTFLTHPAILSHIIIVLQQKKRSLQLYASYTPIGHIFKQLGHTNILPKRHLYFYTFRERETSRLCTWSYLDFKTIKGYDYVYLANISPLLSLSSLFSLSLSLSQNILQISQTSFNCLTIYYL